MSYSTLQIKHEITVSQTVKQSVKTVKQKYKINHKYL